MLVGGRSRRSVVTAASYEARVFGVRSAMPMMEAMRKCPHAIVVESRGDRYGEVSAEIFEIFRRYTPLVEGLSIDEAFLDVTASQSLFGDGVAIARAIKTDIKRELELTASAGVAASKFVAKIASDLEKPDGLTIVPDDVRGFLSPLPIERMWGVGPKTAEKLRAMGYRTLGDLAEARAIDLEIVLGSWGEVVRQLARGIDDREVEPHGAPKSIGAEETYEHDLFTREDIALRLLGQASRVAQRMFLEGWSARTIVVKLKYADFTVVSRRASLADPVMDTKSIHDAACRSLDKFPDIGVRGVRLTGISVAGLVKGPPPDKLFDDDGSRRRRTLEEITARVAERWDEAHLTRASLLGRRGQDRERVNPEAPRGQTRDEESQERSPAHGADRSNARGPSRRGAS